MKWTSKGHEFDKYAEDLMRYFDIKENNIYIFGAGIIGREIKNILKKAGYFSGFVDNDEKKQIQGIAGEAVISLQDYLGQGRKGVLVIAAEEKNVLAITKQLESAGLEAEKDFYEHMNFMKNIFPILLLYTMNQLYIELAQICLTERCSLKCKKCAHACYAVDMKNQDMSLDMAKKSADYFFYYVDIVREFVLIGGEPFLYKNLSEIIEYIGENYREKIGIFSITTNGTIIPERCVLESCRKYDVIIHISNYSATVQDIEKKYKKLEDKLNKNQVSYTLGEKEMQWMDYGFETIDKNECEHELIRTFDKCKTNCREVRGERFYYCVMARSVSDNLKLGLGGKDYLDLGEIEGEDKKIFLEYQMGFSEKGYLDMCNHCNGADAVNYPIPAAEQLTISR